MAQPPEPSTWTDAATLPAKVEDYPGPQHYRLKWERHCRHCGVAAYAREPGPDLDEGLAKACQCEHLAAMRAELIAWHEQQRALAQQRDAERIAAELRAAERRVADAAMASRQPRIADAALRATRSPARPPVEPPVLTEEQVEQHATQRERASVRARFRGIME